jgi:transposase
MEKQIRLPVNPKYTQDWHKYNLAKCNEKRLFVELLHDLSKIIDEPEYKFGRPPVSIRDLFFSAGIKVYSDYSGRKVMSDVKHSEGAGYIKNSPHFNTLKEFFNCPATYDLLQKLLTISAMPLRKLEDKYSIDSSGFGSYQYERWQRVKWGSKKGFRNYLKGHIMIGTKTNIICSCEITPGNFSDVRQAPKIILRAGANFPMKEISADKAYSSKLVYRIIQSVGAIPYIPFKNNSKEPKENELDLWNQMFLIFRDKKEEFGEHYHKRSNVETTFAMVKVRLGEFLKSKNFEAQRNELMVKFICHNICCLIQEMYENNIKINFGKCNKVYVERKVPEELDTRPVGKAQI